MRTFNFRAIILILIAFVLGCSEFIIVGILNDLAHQFNKPVTTVGYLVTIFAFVYAFSTPILTALIGKFCYFWSLFWFMIIFILSNLLSFIAPNYEILVVSRIMTALVSGIIVSLALTFANLIAPLEKRAWLVSWVFSGFSIASVFGVPLGTWISTTFNWRISFAAIAVVSIITLALFTLSMPVAPIAKSSKILEQLSLVRDSRVWLGALLVMLSASGIYVFYTYLRPILTTELNFSTDSLSMLLFIFGLMSIISNRASGYLAENNGLLKMPLVYSCQVILFILMIFLPYMKWPGLLVILLLGATMYLLNSPIQVHFFSVAEKDYPQSLVLSSSLNSIFFNFGISLGSATGGVLVASHGLSAIGPGASVFAILSIVIAILLNKEISHHNKMKINKVVEINN
ncbi:MFS transporter [Liquorilactobacillus mali]|uniref:MFS transporter n=1 Tax=Liquorilactobacillus mali TaxID=1618 RepID=UPI002652272C|nr:MFS transporter [Liquorilactobacillus mali]MDN7145739.1 MFS transporter [Liquorilactobacillus mali]